MRKLRITPYIIILNNKQKIVMEADMDSKIYSKYLDALKGELVLALGCTEPIAVAYAAAKAREVLGSMPKELVVKCSGNIIKNVKSVIVPTTGDMRGIDTSAVLGALAGNAEYGLEVLKNVKKEDVEETKRLLDEGICKVEIINGISKLHIIVEATDYDTTVTVEISECHTNIVSITKNGEVLFSRQENAPTVGAEEMPVNANDEDNMSLEEIYRFANEVDIADVKEILDRQISCNLAIAKEGLRGDYGANVGKTIIKNYGEDVKFVARAYPAAGSDARMSGCTMPVVINSGSGNQGMTVSLPVIIYARHLNVSDEKLYRALVLSNLLAIHLKFGIGKLSAYCGVVSAACGSGAAISYLHDAPLSVIEKTITNTLGNVSGIVCDGAKSSCAAKIASSVDAAIMGHCMAMDNYSFGAGEGLVKDNIEKTIDTISTMGREGMKQTDEEILSLMLKD